MVILVVILFGVLAASSSLPIEALYARLPREQPAAIRAAVLELALHEIVAIER